MKPLTFQQKVLTIALFAALALSSSWNPLFHQKVYSANLASSAVRPHHVQKSDIKSTSTYRNYVIYQLNNGDSFALTDAQAGVASTQSEICVECLNGSYSAADPNHSDLLGSVMVLINNINAISAQATVQANQSNQSIQPVVDGAQSESQQLKNLVDNDPCADRSTSQAAAGCYRGELQQISRLGNHIKKQKELDRLSDRDYSDPKLVDQLQNDHDNYQTAVKTALEGYLKNIARAKITLVAHNKDEADSALDDLDSADTFVGNMEDRFKRRLGVEDLEINGKNNIKIARDEIKRIQMEQNALAQAQIFRQQCAGRLQNCSDADTQAAAAMFKQESLNDSQALLNDGLAANSADMNLMSMIDDETYRMLGNPPSQTDSTAALFNQLGTGSSSAVNSATSANNALNLSRCPIGALRNGGCQLGGTNLTGNGTSVLTGTYGTINRSRIAPQLHLMTTTGIPVITPNQNGFNPNLPNRGISPVGNNTMYGGPTGWSGQPF